MDRKKAQRLFFDHATAVAYIDVEAPNGDRSIGSAFHVGGGVFVTARHVVYGKRIVEMKVMQPVVIGTSEFYGISEDEARAMDKPWADVGHKQTYNHWLKPFDIVEGPAYDEEGKFDVAVLRVSNVHPAMASIKLGLHYDDWVYRSVWNLEEAIIMGYPPVPMVNEPVLLAARAEIHTFVVPRHSLAVHFILSATPRGGFSGGVAIHEHGYALGVITSSFVGQGEQSGFLAVLSVEAIRQCLETHGMFPEIQRQVDKAAFEAVRLAGEKLRKK